jgi:hypothetical protein
LKKLPWAPALPHNAMQKDGHDPYFPLLLCIKVTRLSTPLERLPKAATPTTRPLKPIRGSPLETLTAKTQLRCNIMDVVQQDM